MRTIRIITIVLAAFAVTAVIAALSMNSKWQVQVSRHISAPAQDIFPYINTLKKWPEWTVWNNSNHPQLQMTYEGAESGVGAIQIWHEGSDKGKLEIISSESNQSIEYRLNMAQGLFLIHGRISLSESQQGTLVTWQLWGDNGTNLIARLMTLAFKPMLKKDLVVGLSTLQNLITQQP